MVSLWGGIPKCSMPAPKHHQVAWPERTLAGEGEGPVQLTRCSFAQRALSELLAGRIPPGLFSVPVHRIPIKQSHWSATQTSHSYQEEGTERGSSSQAPSTRSCRTGTSVCSLETEPPQSGVLYRKL